MGGAVTAKTAVENDLRVEEALPELLKAALADRPVERLQAVVRATPRLAERLDSCGPGSLAR